MKWEIIIPLVLTIVSNLITVWIVTYNKSAARYNAIKSKHDAKKSMWDARKAELEYREKEKLSNKGEQ